MISRQACPELSGRDAKLAKKECCLYFQTLAPFAPLRDILRFGCGVAALGPRCLGRRGERQRDTELSAGWIVGLDPKTAAMKLDEVSDDGQPDTRRLVVFVFASAEGQRGALGDVEHLLFQQLN